MKDEYDRGRVDVRNERIDLYARMCMCGCVLAAVAHFVCSFCAICVVRACAWCAVAWHGVAQQAVAWCGALCRAVGTRACRKMSGQASAHARGACVRACAQAHAHV